MRNQIGRRLRPLFVLSPLLLAACATPGVSPPQANLIQAEALQLQTAKVPGNWWQQLHDPVLDELLARAIQQHPRLDMAAARQRAAEAGMELAASGSGWRVNGQASVSRDRSSEFGNNPPQYRGQWTSLNTLGLELSWRSDFWGKTAARLAASRGQAAAAGFELADAQQWLVWAIASQYVEWRSAARQQAMLAEDVRLAEAQRAISLSRQKLGLAAPDELAQLDAQLAESRERQERSRFRLAQAVNALAALSGQAAGDIQRLPAADVPDWQLDTAGWHSNLLGQRPDLAAARERVEAAAANIKVARAAYYPDFSLNALLSLSASDLGDLLRPGARLLHLAPALSLPIFSNGELDARLSVSHADYQQAVAVYNQTLLNAMQESADRLAQLQAMHGAETQGRQQLAAREQALAIADSRLATGLAGKGQQLAEQRRVLQSRLSLLETRSQRLQAQAALMRALGSSVEFDKPV